MRQLKSFSLHGKTWIILGLCLSIPFISIWYIVKYVSEDIFYGQKRSHLMSIAEMLDTQLVEGGYDEILQNAGALDTSREEKIAILNRELAEVTDNVSHVSEGLGVGFYSMELDAILTYGPSAEYAHTIGVSIAPDHPGRQVMTQNTPIVEKGSMVRGDIMNAMYPIVRNGEVIGYIWANELVSDLEMTLRRTSTIVLALLIFAYILMIVMVMAFFLKMLRSERESQGAISQALEETQHLDRLMNLVNEAVATLLMADGDSFETALQDCMKMMGSALEVDRISICRHSVETQGDGWEPVLAAHWFSGSDSGKDYDLIDLNSSDFLGIKELSGWQKRLSNNEIVTLLDSQLSEQERTSIEHYGIRSWMAVPVFLQEVFWGFVSFCSCQKERKIAEDEQKVLLSGSLLMANAISRNDMLQRLVQAREDALAGTRAKSAFLASMSHEIRTPINAIVGMAAIGQAATSSERKDYAFGKIKNASTHLTGVINDVLDISKIESGKLELAYVEFDFEEIIIRVSDVITPAMKEKDQIFTVNVDPLIPSRLLSDDQRMTQVITNLLSNASKFTHSGGSITLTARLLGKEDGVCTIQIDVSDTGIGISAEQQEKIFKSFEQAESSTTRRYGGTGLGLAITKKIVELMGGRIWIESELGKGSTFSLTIQAGYSDQLSENASQLVGGAEGAFAQDGESLEDFAGHNILLAEDIEINREILVTLLEPTGLQIDCAENGAEAVEMFRNAPERYDLIFMDVHMPELDGLEATRQIRSLNLPNANTVPIIAMTANVFTDDIEKCLQAGMNDHVGKPLDMEKLLSILKQYL